jgi:hypothetical protein
LVGKPKGKRPLSRPRHWRKDGSEWILERLTGGGIDWIQLNQDRKRWWALVNIVTNLRVLVTQS